MKKNSIQLLCFDMVKNMLALICLASMIRKTWFMKKAEKRNTNKEEKNIAMPKYTSKELNDKIEQLENRHAKELEICGGKIVPYIGWYWRGVDFDSKTYNFGIIDDDPEGFVGFMENNKWHYPYTQSLQPEERAKVRCLIESLVDNPNSETAKNLWDYVQRFRGDI